MFEDSRFCFNKLSARSLKIFYEPRQIPRIMGTKLLRNRKTKSNVGPIVVPTSFSREPHWTKYSELRGKYCSAVLENLFSLFQGSNWV